MGIGNMGAGSRSHAT